jgi:aminoglycoside phosphotransferase (APT) family kinase protein
MIRGPWSDDALAVIAQLLRQLHDASESYDPPPDALWRHSFARSLPAGRRVIGHGDLGPWNIVARDGLPVAFIDWDHAGPVGAIWDLAQTAWLNVQLHDDDVAELQGLSDLHDRGRQLRLFVDAYGLPLSEREGLVASIAEFAIHSAREEAIEHGVKPTSNQAVDESGYPIMWAIAWWARSASWILRHHRVLEHYLTACTMTKPARLSPGTAIRDAAGPASPRSSGTRAL